MTLIFRAWQALIAIAIFGSIAAVADVHVTKKSLKDATHVELSGLSEWRYEVSRKSGEDANVVSVQLTGVKPSDVRSLEDIRDNRVRSVKVEAGVNGDARVDFKLAGKGVSMFDYQTEAPASLILDIFKEEPVAKKTDAPARTSKSAEKSAGKAAKFADLIAPSKGKKVAAHAGKKQNKNSRGVASVDHPEIGSQPLLASNVDASKLQLKYGVFDGGDQDFSRFKISDDEISETAQIKSEKDMFLHFPILNLQHGYLNDLLGDMPKYEVEANDSEENQQIRLIIKLFNEEKYAVTLRTLKFFREKFPQTNYQKTVDFITADTYLKLWLRDHNRVDFEQAMARYKEILNRYPQDPTRYRTLMFIGLNYMDIGNNLGALSTFQVGVKNYPESQYYWQMRMEVAEALISLEKQNDALKELTEIENNPKAKNYSVEARFRRGDVYFKAKDYTAAVKEYEEAKKKYEGQVGNGPNLFFNEAEAEFWRENYKTSLDEFRTFLEKFPTHPYGGYAMTRIGEILGILGASKQKVEGAFLESYFRYHNSPGAYVAKVHVNTGRYGSMKEKELDAARDEIRAELSKIPLDDVETFVTLHEADGFTDRKDYDASNDMLIRYYQSNVLSPYLPIVRDRIVSNITRQIASADEKGDYVKALGYYIKNGTTWLQKNDRIDTKFFAAKGYENLNVLNEAAKLYGDCLARYNAMKPEELKRAKVFEDLPDQDRINLRLAAVSMKSDEVKKAGVFLGSIKDVARLSESEQVERSLILSAVAEKEERTDIALLALKDLSEHWKGNPLLMVKPWLRMARISAKLNKTDDSLSWLEKIVTAASKNPDTIDAVTAREGLLMAAELYTKSGRTPEALSSYQMVLDKFPGASTAEVRYKLGKLHFDQGDYRTAAETWAPLKKEKDGQFWDKLASDQMAAARWNQKYGRYIERKPAGGNNK